MTNRKWVIPVTGIFTVAWWKCGVNVLLGKSSKIYTHRKALCNLLPPGWFHLVDKSYFCCTKNLSILHAPYTESSTDSFHCCDTVNHMIGSIFVQAMHISVILVKCSLFCLQKMQFFLNGPDLTIKVMDFLRLAQGIGSTLYMWIAVSTRMLGSNKRACYRSYIRGAWSGALLNLVAILYVEDIC